MLFPPLSIHDTQAQALAQQFAELSRLTQPPFCLSQHLFRDGLPDPTLSWLKGRLKGWLKGLKGLVFKPFSQFSSEYQRE